MSGPLVNKKKCFGDILVHVHVFSTNFIQASSLEGLGLGFLSLTPLSIIFQLYHGGQFYTIMATTASL